MVGHGSEVHTVIARRERDASPGTGLPFASVTVAVALGLDVKRPLQQYLRLADRQARGGRVQLRRLRRE